MDLAALLPILKEWGAPGLVTVTVLAILTGRLVPLRFYRAVAEERDQWREAAMKASQQKEELLPAAQITSAVVRQLAAQTSRRSGDE